MQMYGFYKGDRVGTGSDASVGVGSPVRAKSGGDVGAGAGADAGTSTGGSQGRGRRRGREHPYIQYTYRGVLADSKVKDIIDCIEPQH